MLENAFDQYVARLEKMGRSKHSLLSYGYTYKQYIQEGHTIIDDPSVEAFLGKHENAATRNKKLAHLQSFVKWLRKKHGWNALGLVGQFTLQSERFDLGLPVVLDKDKINTILEWLKSYPVAHAHAHLMLGTGMRFGEAWKMRTSHYKTDPARFQFTHKGKERIVPLSRQVLPYAMIWIGQRETMPTKTLYKLYGKASKATGIPFVPHHFRHTVATTLRAHGVSYDDISDLLGNTPQVCKARYSRVDVVSLSSLVEVL